MIRPKVHKDLQKLLNKHWNKVVDIRSSGKHHTISLENGEVITLSRGNHLSAYDVRNQKKAIERAVYGRNDCHFSSMDSRKNNLSTCKQRARTRRSRAA